MHLVEFPIIHQLNAGKYLYEAASISLYDRNANSTESFLSCQEMQMAGKIVQVVEELSTSHCGLPALTSADLD